MNTTHTTSLRSTRKNFSKPEKRDKSEKKRIPFKTRRNKDGVTEKTETIIVGPCLDNNNDYTKTELKIEDGEHEFKKVMEAASALDFARLPGADSTNQLLKISNEDSLRENKIFQALEDQQRKLSRLEEEGIPSTLNKSPRSPHSPSKPENATLFTNETSSPAVKSAKSSDTNPNDILSPRQVA